MERQAGRITNHGNAALAFDLALPSYPARTMRWSGFLWRHKRENWTTNNIFYGEHKINEKQAVSCVSSSLFHPCGGNSDQ